jgi:Protein of unknown function DUF262
MNMNPQSGVASISEEEIDGYESAPPSLGADHRDELTIRDERRSAVDVVRRINSRRFRMDPDFQRDFVWKKDKQSRLIESILMRIPLPVFYVAEDDNGLNVVVDGRQRLTTLRRFLDNEFELDLPDRPEFNAKNYKSLDPRLQNRIEDCQLHFYIIDKMVPESARLDIFERVNGGEPLTRQQMRNAMYNGIATDFLKKQAQLDIFRQATGSTLKAEKMQDREFVNRFAAFSLLQLSDYRGDMDKWLADSLKKLKTIDEAERNTLQLKFQQGLENNFYLFGEHAFRKHSAGANRRDRRRPINASLFDVMMIELSQYDNSLVEAKQEKIKEIFYNLLQEGSEFWNSISYSPNSSEQVNSRFRIAKNAFNEVFHAD